MSNGFLSCDPPPSRLTVDWLSPHRSANPRTGRDEHGEAQQREWLPPKSSHSSSPEKQLPCVGIFPIFRDTPSHIPEKSSALYPIYISILSPLWIMVGDIPTHGVTLKDPHGRHVSPPGSSDPSNLHALRSKAPENPPKLAAVSHFPFSSRKSDDCGMVNNGKSWFRLITLIDFPSVL